ncbi:MAG: hypothetical protein KGL69_06980 [Alphaproteobacteria bacterium]|nr:hypothetical protein [Alphaproteobacteria bacterium]
MTPPRPVAVVGLQSEARRIAGLGLDILIGGGDSAALAARLDAALTQGAAGVISLGLCGALDPTLGLGDLVIGQSVATSNSLFRADPAWTRRLAARLPAARLGVVAAEDRPVVRAQDKRDLAARTGALIADMESHLVARAATAHNRPFVVLRAPSDLASQTLPPAALVGMKSDGGTDLAAVLASLIRAPAQLPALMALARGAGAGLKALERAARASGPDFAFSDRPSGEA